MAWRGSDNLGYYLSHAVLPQMVPGVGAPEMPRQGHGSHRNKLTVRPEPYRKLQSIYQLIEEVFDTLIAECESRNILIFIKCVLIRATRD
jgi:hypothetical protein